tara:strand:+ start:113 stop:301 length:189 start_codon:yes stop_codon:yes gene_type:complete
MHYIHHAIKVTYKYNISKHSALAKLVEALGAESGDDEAQLLVKDINNYIVGISEGVNKEDEV